MKHGLQTGRVAFRLGERAPALLVCICFFDARLSRSTCQVGYVQYIHTFTHGPLSSRPWLPHTHQTARESQSDTNYAEGVGELLANTTLCWLAVTPAHLICSSGLRAAARVSVYVCKWIRIGGKCKEPCFSKYDKGRYCRSDTLE